MYLHIYIWLKLLDDVSLNANVRLHDDVNGDPMVIHVVALNANVFGCRCQW